MPQNYERRQDIMRVKVAEKEQRDAKVVTQSITTVQLASRILGVTVIFYENGLAEIHINNKRLYRGYNICEGSWVRNLKESREDRKAIVHEIYKLCVDCTRHVVEGIDFSKFQ